MAKYLTLMNEDYKKKYYPNGYLEGVRKSLSYFPKKLYIYGIISLILSVPLITFGIWLFATSHGDSGRKTAGNIIIFIGVFFLIQSICVFYMKKIRSHRTPETILNLYVEENNYPKSVIQEYVNQVLNSDTYILYTTGQPEAKSDIGYGFLTRDFLGFDSLVKRSDIIAARLVYVAETNHDEDNIMTNNVLNIAFLCKNARCLMIPVNKEAAEELTAMLITQNPYIDIRLENILTEKELEEYTQETFDNLQ